MNLTRISNKSDYVNKVYEKLLDAITDGRLAPGIRIKQEELAEILNVSRSPVLLALRLLKKDGLLSDAVGRGLVVAPVDPVQMRQLYQVRGAIDTLAAKLAASRRARIPESILQKGRIALETQDVSAMVEADMAFHSAISEDSGTTSLSATQRCIGYTFAEPKVRCLAKRMTGSRPATNTKTSPAPYTAATVSSPRSFRSTTLNWPIAALHPIASRQSRLKPVSSS